MVVLLVLAEVAMRPPAEIAAPATATVRIERGAAVARRDQWEKLPRLNRRETVRKEADGRTIVLRVVEHE